MPVPSLGSSLRCLVGEAVYYDDLNSVLSLTPPDTYDSLLRTVSYAAPLSAVPYATDWTRRAFSEQTYNASPVKHYKPVDRKVRPVPSYMPNPDGQVFKPIIIEKPPPLPFNPPPLADFKVSELGQLTRERLDHILAGVRENFLLPREIDLLVYVLI